MIQAEGGSVRSSPSQPIPQYLVFAFTSTSSKKLFALLSLIEPDPGMTPVDEPAPAGHATTTSTTRQPPPILSFAPLPRPSGPLTLLFYPDHPCATRIIDGATNEVLYVVETEVTHEPLLKKRTVTTVRRATPEAAIAQFQWKDFFTSDAVALTREMAGSTAGKGSDEGKGFGKGGEGLITMPARAWLKKSAVPFKDTVTYKDPERKAYTWKGFAPGLSLELYSSETPTVALVQFHKGRDSSTSKTMTGTRAIEEGGRRNSESKVRSRARHPAHLTIDTSLVRSGRLDEMVVAFLYLEKVRRERDDDEFKVVPKMPPEAQKRPSSSK